MKALIRIAVAVALLPTLIFAPTLSAHAAPQPTPVERPPQLVLLAFDGSLNLDMWKETLDFAHATNLKFTYFISGVYFLLNSHRTEYDEPTHGIGKSAIGFGGDSPEKIVRRVGYVNQAYDEGHEIASHVNGHFDGSHWTLEQWASEFKQFYHLIFDVFQINKITTATGHPYHFNPEQVVGFRAPLLGLNSAMYEVLAENHYTYDTSRTADMTYWPELKGGIWNFPLAQVRIAGTGKRTLSMDYNFYYAQSAGRENPANAEEYYQEMLQTYMGYFHLNYYGNRAPIHIGHHFSKWNGGAYWRAMQDFAKNVCGMPEVKCISYGELVKFMNALTPEQLTAYRHGRFDKLQPSDHTRIHLTSVRPLDVDLRIKKVDDQSALQAEITGAQAKMFQASAKGVSYLWTLNGETIALDSAAQLGKLQLNRLPRALAAGDQLAVRLLHGRKEVLRATHPIMKPSFGEFEVAPESLEVKAVGGDLPEAHREEQ